MGIYLSNLVNDFKQEANAEPEKEKVGKYKYEMQLNHRIAIGILKEELIHLPMEENMEKRQEIMNAILAEVKKNLLPVRKGWNESLKD